MADVVIVGQIRDDDPGRECPKESYGPGRARKIHPRIDLCATEHYDPHVRDFTLDLCPQLDWGARATGAIW
jgi:hypothetical protein